MYLVNFALKGKIAMSRAGKNNRIEKPFLGRIVTIQPYLINRSVP